MSKRPHTKTLETATTSEKGNPKRELAPHGTRYNNAVDSNATMIKGMLDVIPEWTAELEYMQIEGAWMS